MKIRMASPPQALAWQLTHRYRWGLVPLAAYLLVLCLYFSLAPAAAVSAAAASIAAIPLAVGVAFVLGVCTFGLEVNVADRQSGYPARMFTLPVRTSGLIGWPMLYGTLAMALGWALLAQFVLRPAGINAQVWLPALTFASVAAWLQALSWAPFGLPQVRLALISLVLTALVSLPIVATTGEVPTGWLLVLQACTIAPAVLVAWRGVGQARRGDSPDWQWLVRAVGSVAALLPRRQFAFESADEAQCWFEWRRHGLVLPLFIAIVAPFSAWLVLKRPEPPMSPSYLLAFVIFFPLAVASALGGNLGRPDFWSKKSRMTAFAATRPIRCSQFVAAKLRMAAASTAVTWLLLMPVVLLWFAREGRWAMLRDAGRGLVGQQPGWLVHVALGFGLLVLVALTWKLLSDGFLVGLSGQPWVAHAVTCTCVALFMAGIAFGWWAFDHPSETMAMRPALPWIAAGLVAVKLLLAIWVRRALIDRGLLAAAKVNGYVLLWLLVGAYLVAMFSMLIPSAMVPRHWIVLGVALLVPFNTLAAAPLAVAWNRHR